MQRFPIVPLYSPLVAIPAEEIAAILLMAKALELNAFQTFTRGGAIVAIWSANLLVFCYNFPLAGGNAKIFSQVLGSFIETLPKLLTLRKLWFCYFDLSYTSSRKSTSPIAKAISFGRSFSNLCRLYQKSLTKFCVT